MAITAFIKSSQSKRAKLRFKYDISLIAALFLLSLTLAHGQTPSADLEYQKALALNKSANYIESAKKIGRAHV